jgi:predicted nuclease of predicted toxin-antitoxin system
MKLLLDENLPRRLSSHLVGHSIYSVGQLGWQGKKNGQLMALMLENEFDGMITIDKSIGHQQNFIKYPIAIFILDAKSNSLEILLPFVPNLLLELNKVQRSGATVIRL